MNNAVANFKKQLFKKITLIKFFSESVYFNNIGSGSVIKSDVRITGEKLRIAWLVHNVKHSVGVTLEEHIKESVVTYIVSEKTVKHKSRGDSSAVTGVFFPCTSKYCKELFNFSQRCKKPV